MDHDGVRRLLAEAGVDGARFRTALALLCDGRWWTLAELVRATATSRRGVEALLREVAPERSGERFRLTAEQAGACRALLSDDEAAAGGPADPVAHLLAGRRGLVERLAGLIERAPRGRRALDHVAATPETVARRALLLGARFRLTGARLLCVGDHDLTSLAVKLAHPGVDVTVADIDERILAYIDEQADRLGVEVRTLWADLRLGLPQSARDQADLAFTDPPYTPEGVGLFVARAVEGLRDPERGRVLLAYGASERTPTLALKVQSSLHDLNLAYEAMYPDFNRYFGAEAIGSAADLYILRPTTRTRPAVAARADRYGTAIYTQGGQSVESRPAATPMDAQRARDSLGGLSPGVLVGDWPKDVLPKIPRARLSTWLAKPYAAAPERVAIAVPAGLEGAIPRLLLATRARQVRVLGAGPWVAEPGTAEPGGGRAGTGEAARVAGAARAPDGWARALDPVYRLTAAGAVLDAVRAEPPAGEAGRVLRGIFDNAHGRLANTWREALIRARPALTKRQARAVIAETAPWAAEATLLELPAHRLRALPEAVAASLRAAAAAE